MQITAVPVGLALPKGAADAPVGLGKGRHPAALNCGGRLAYALAHSLGAPVLCKGRDFALTDIVAA